MQYEGRRDGAAGRGTSLPCSPKENRQTSLRGERRSGPRSCHLIPAYVNIKTLASELEISETQVYALVRGGVLPKPLKLTAGCVRWSWAAVETALASLQSGGQPEAGNDPDPLMRMIRDAEARERGEEPDPFMQRIREAQKAKALAKGPDKQKAKP